MGSYTTGQVNTPSSKTYNLKLMITQGVTKENPDVNAGWCELR